MSNFFQKKSISLRKCQRPTTKLIPDAVLSTSYDAALAFADIVEGKLHSGPAAENLVVLFLNAQNNLNNYYRIEGTVDHAAVYPREIVSAALDSNAVSAIMVHNHPSGQTGFSSQDVSFTRRMVDALKTVDITLHDSIVVGFLETGGITYSSMSEQGYMPRPQT